MSDTTKTKTLTAKSFLHKTTTKAAVSASAFLQQYREFLITGELADVTSPIIQRMDAGQIMPTPALFEIQNAVMTHIIEMDRRKMEEKLSAQEAAASVPKVRNGWVAIVYDAKGIMMTRTKDNGEVVDLIRAFEDSASADRWSSRMLFEHGASDWYAEIENTAHNIKTVMTRDMAIALILAKKKGPAMHQKKMSTNCLSFQPKCVQDRASFSRG